MNALKLIPVVLSFLLLAAHFLRADLVFTAGLCVAMPLLLLFRERWVPLLFQVLLVLGALEWLHTLIVFAGERMDAGRPWIRMVVILGAVMLFTALSGLVFRSNSLRSWFAGKEL